MLIKRKRSIVLLLVFIFTISLVFSQLWMLMTRYDNIEDIFAGGTDSSNRIQTADVSSRYRGKVTNISATINNDRRFVNEANEDLSRHRDDGVNDARTWNKLNDERNGAPDPSMFEAANYFERRNTMSQLISINPTEELRNGDPSQSEKTQNDIINSADVSNLSIVPKGRSTKKVISDGYPDESGIVYLNRSTENAVRNSDIRDSEKSADLFLKNKYLKIIFTQKPVSNRTMSLNNTLENQELYFPLEIPSESEEFHKDISKDDFAADDLAIRGDVDQIPKIDQIPIIGKSTTRNHLAFSSARVENNNYTARRYFAGEDNFGVVSNSESLVPLPTKSIRESDDDTNDAPNDAVPNDTVSRSRINVPNSPGINVVSMSLYGSDVRYTMGALRNAEMIRQNFPGWTLRIYIESAASSTPRHGPVPANVVQSLRRLNAEIQYVMPEQDFIPPMMWRFLVADDLSVDRFIVRDTDSRLTARDAASVAAWIRSDKPFHSIRDHPSHSAYAVSGGLWGGKTAELRDILRRSWIDVMRGLAGDYFRDMSFLNDIIWPRVKQHAYCSDSVSCDRWPNSFPFPVRRRGTEHVGQVYDERDVGREGDVRILRAAGEYPRCLPQGGR